LAELILFHHAQGLTPGMHAFADELRGAGHVVHTPDLYEGMTFENLDDGVAHAREVGFDKIFERGRTAAERLPAFPVSEFGDRWPAAVPLQIHMMEADPWVIPPNEDLELARALVRAVDGAELFLYPGDSHLFADRSLPDYDADAAGLLMHRVQAFLDRVKTA